MQLFLEQLKSDLTCFDAPQLVERLRRQILNDALPGQTAMLPSYVQTLPCGDEQGEYLTLDLGGSNFRAALVRIPGDRKPPQLLRTAQWCVRDTAKYTTSDIFFDWIASCVHELLGAEDRATSWRTGLTFSFPINETSINTGHIMTMGKDYCFADNIGSRCIKSHLQKAFIGWGLKINLVAVINDSVSTLITHSYHDPRTRLSLIQGTGCNSAIYMPIKFLPANKRRVGATSSSGPQGVIVNAELSMLGKDVLPMTKYDRELDEGGPIPRFQLLEQLTAGRHLGELVRLIIADAVKSVHFLDGQLPESLCTKRSINAELLGLLEQDESRDMKASRTLLDEVLPKQAGQYSVKEAKFIRSVARLISSRSAILMAASLTALASFATTNSDDKVHEGDETVVAFCGSFIEKYPTYRERCQDTLDQLQSGLRLEGSRNSGLIGAAITAAMVCRDT